MKKKIKGILTPPLKDLLNENFIPLWKCKDRFVILYGSRQSSKSDFVAFRIVTNMINDPYFKGVAIYKDYNKIERNLVDTVLKVIDRYGLNQLFDYKKSPFTITCKQNGNKLYFGGLSDPGSYRGISDLTTVWFEETPTETEEDWSNISLTLRHPTALLQEFYTINPVIENYEDHYFYKMFFEGERELSFRKKIELVNEEGKTYTQYATIHHSSYKQNRWCSEQAIASIELQALRSPYLFQVFKLGIWANKIIEGRYYNKFDPALHVNNKAYNPDKPLHCSWDFNKRPYCGITIYQVYEKTVYCIDEICTFTKDLDASSVEQSCQKLLLRYGSHQQGIYIYGDPSGRTETAMDKPGNNYYNTIIEQLKRYNPILRVQNVAPLQKTAGEFVNSIFQHNYSGIQIYIDDKCKELIKDLLYMKMDKEGDIEVEHIKNEDGFRIEKYGHQGANFRYFLTSYFNDEYNLHKNPLSYPTEFVGKTRSQLTSKKRAW